MDLRTAIISLYSINGPILITEKECIYCAVRIESSNIIQVNRSLDMVKDCQIWTLATAVRFHLPSAPYPTWTPRGGMGPSDFNVSGLIMKHLAGQPLLQTMPWNKMPSPGSDTWHLIQASVPIRTYSYCQGRLRGGLVFTICCSFVM